MEKDDQHESEIKAHQSHYGANLADIATRISTKR